MAAGIHTQRRNGTKGIKGRGEKNNIWCSCHWRSLRKVEAKQQQQQKCSAVLLPLFCRVHWKLPSIASRAALRLASRLMAAAAAMMSFPPDAPFLVSLQPESELIKSDYAQEWISYGETAIKSKKLASRWLTAGARRDLSFSCPFWMMNNSKTNIYSICIAKNKHLLQWLF